MIVENYNSNEKENFIVREKIIKRKSKIVDVQHVNETLIIRVKF